MLSRSRTARIKHQVGGTAEYQTLPDPPDSLEVSDATCMLAEQPLGPLKLAVGYEFPENPEQDESLNCWAE